MLKPMVKRAGVALTGGKSMGIDECEIVFDAYGATPGVMFDVGSHYGWALDSFASAGWIVHAFEPDPANHAELALAHGHRANVVVNNVGISDKQGSLPLYTSPESTGISSLAPFTDGHEATATVDVTTLKEYLRGTGVNAIDFMKIDVEGFEKHVLEGHDWSVPPRTLVLEFEDKKTEPLGYRWTDLANLLQSKGYHVVLSEWAPIAQYGTPHAWLRFADYPAELSNPAAWGNLIATINDPAPLKRAMRAAKLRFEIANAGRSFLRIS